MPNRIAVKSRTLPRKMKEVVAGLRLTKLPRSIGIAQAKAGERLERVRCPVRSSCGGFRSGSPNLALPQYLSAEAPNGQRSVARTLQSRPLGARDQPRPGERSSEMAGKTTPKKITWRSRPMSNEDKRHPGHVEDHQKPIFLRSYRGATGARLFLAETNRRRGARNATTRGS